MTATGEPAPIRRDVPVANLAFDLLNPRLEEQKTQRDALHAIIGQQGEKLLVLAEDIVESGLDPSSLSIGIADPEDAARVVVVEGNRRLAAVQALSNPDLAADVFDVKAMKRLRVLSAAFAARGAVSVPCVIMPTREAATHWIELRHLGEQGGKGIVTWGGVEKTRFEERQGREARASPALQVLNLVRAKGKLDAVTTGKLGKVPITTVQRVLNDPDVRKKLGIDIQDGRLVRVLEESEVLKGLTRIIRDAAHGKLPVTRVDTKELRKKYLSEFKAGDLPAAGAAPTTAQPIEPGDEGTRATPTSAKRSQQTTKSRPTLIPRKCVLSITDTKTNNIYNELRRLKVEDFPHAGGVLLRVFLELCTDRFISHGKLMTNADVNKSSLRQKLNIVANHLRDAGTLTKGQLTGVRKAADSNQILDCSIDTLHGYVHDATLGPSPMDLKSAWDSLELFFQTICL